MADYIDYNVGIWFQSKMHNVNLNNLTVQNFFFTLQKAQDLQLGIMECKVIS
jgi:hypothetical protein